MRQITEGGNAMHGTTRVLIVDSQPVLAKLQAMLGGESGVEVVGTACTAAEALEWARRLQPHVVLMIVGHGAQSMGDSAPALSHTEGPGQLSSREQEILALLVRGRTIKEVSAELAISVHTVNTHVRNIYKKLQVNDRASMVTTALRLSLVSA